MDPLTLFALANGAVTAIKKGCQLYKDIKGAAGEVKSVLKDLDEQFDRDVEILDQPRQARPWSNSAPIQATASSNMEKRSDTQQEPT